MTFDIMHLIWAVILGALSAVSLPLGSILGLLAKPRPVIVGILAAFGAGALIAALSVELVAPTVSALTSKHISVSEHGNPIINFIALLVGLVIGGGLYVILDQIVNAKGGYLRKYSTTIVHFSKRKKKRNIEILNDLANVKLFTNVPIAHTRQLVDLVFPASFTEGEILFEQGTKGDRLFFIKSGEVELFQDDELISTLSSGDVLGEIALLTGAKRTAKAVASNHVVTLVLRKEDFDELRKYPEIDEAARKLASERMEKVLERKETKLYDVEKWAKRASAALKQGTHIPYHLEVEEEIKKSKTEHGSAPLAIWLGILLDGIPESFVIGSGFFLILSKVGSGVDPSFFSVIPYTLIAGLFLSNFPEAMSSSAGMFSYGFKKRKILVLWTSLMIMTAVGAGFGYFIGESLPHSFVIGIEGIAAGAMLTMIASTMIPEAVHLGGANVVGFSTLIGFLSAIAFKLLE